MSHAPVNETAKRRRQRLLMEATTHPDDLLTHMRVEHLGTLNAISDECPRDVLEMAHAQRHAGFGCGADHPPDSHDQPGEFV